MSHRISKQLIIIVLSLLCTILLVVLMRDNIESVWNPLDNAKTDTTSSQSSAIPQTAIEATVLANNGNNQLQVEAELRDASKVLTLNITDETILLKRVFENGQVQDTKTSLSEVSVGDELSIVIFTGEINLAEQSVITPIELIFRG